MSNTQTELLQLHGVLHHRARQLSLLNNLAREMTGLLDSTAIYDLVTQQLWQQFGYYSVEAFRVEPEHKQIVLESCAGAYAHLIHPGQYRQTVGQGIIGMAVATGEIVLANQARKHPAFYYLKGAEVQAELSIPLKRGDWVIGVLNVDSEQVDAFDETDITLLTTVADQMVIALEKSRLFEETEQRADELARLFAAAQDLATTLNSTELLTKIIRHLTEAVQATSGYILALQPEQQQVLLLAEYWSETASEQEKVSDLGCAYNLTDYHKMAQAITTRMVVSFYVHDEDLGATERQQLMAYGIKSALIVPFVARGRVLGEAEIWESRTRRTFTRREMNLAQAIAQHAASVIDNVRLFEEVQAQAILLEEQVTNRTTELVKANEQLRQEIGERRRAEDSLRSFQVELKAQAEALGLVNAIAETLHRTLNFEAVVERAVNALITYARFEAAGIFVLFPDGQNFELLSSRNFSPEIRQLGRKLPVVGSLAGEAVRRREIVTSEDMCHDPRLSPDLQEFARQHNLRAAIVIPIFYQTEVLGTVHLLAATLSQLTPLTLRMLTAIGRTIGLAMSNARYVNQIESEIQERREIETALRESEMRFRQLADNAGDLIFRFRFEPFGYDYVNPTFTRLTGYTPQELYEEPHLVFKTLHPGDNPVVEAFLRKEIDPDNPVQFRVLHRDGSVRWLEQKLVPILNSEGDIVAVEGIGRDITEMKETLMTLQAMQDADE